MDVSEITELMAQLGRRMNLGRVLAFEDVGTWELDYDERTALLVDRNDANASLVFSGTIARPHKDREADYHRMLLEYNYQWQQTNGVRMAIEPTEGDAVLIYEMPLAKADLDQLEIVVTNLLALLTAWRAALQTAGGTTTPPFTDPHGGEGFFIKI